MLVEFLYNGVIYSSMFEDKEKAFQQYSKLVDDGYLVVPNMEFDLRMKGEAL